MQQHRLHRPVSGCLCTLRHHPRISCVPDAFDSADARLGEAPDRNGAAGVVSHRCIEMRVHKLGTAVSKQFSFLRIVFRVHGLCIKLQTDNLSASSTLITSVLSGDPLKSPQAASSTSLAQKGSKDQQSPAGLPSAPTGSAVENATSRFSLPTPTLAVRNLVCNSTLHQFIRHKLLISSARFNCCSALGVALCAHLLVFVNLTQTSVQEHHSAKKMHTSVQILLHFSIAPAGTFIHVMICYCV